MQDYQELVPDAEMFARVWKRVMPDENLSQIVVHQPQQKKEHEVPRKPAAPQPKARGDEEVLGEVLREMERGAAQVGEILRREPGAWPLRESMAKSAAQLKAAWLLLTGARWKDSGGKRPAGVPRETLLREQYLWELRFSELCREAGKQLKAADAAEIMPEQEAASTRRRRMLRHMLGGGK